MSQTSASAYTDEQCIHVLRRLAMRHPESDPKSWVSNRLEACRKLMSSTAKCFTVIRSRIETVAKLDTVDIDEEEDRDNLEYAEQAIEDHKDIEKECLLYGLNPENFYKSTVLSSDRFKRLMRMRDKTPKGFQEMMRHCAENAADTSAGGPDGGVRISAL